MLASNTIPLPDLDCEINYKDSSGDSFVLEAPNGSGMFQFTISRDQSALYRDANRNRRVGYNDLRVSLEFNYSSHKMPIHKLLISEYVEITWGDIFLPFTNTDFIFDGNSIVKNWYSNHVVTGSTEDVDGYDIVPMGQATLNFTSINSIDINARI